MQNGKTRNDGQCCGGLKYRTDGGISIKDDSLGIDWRIPTENALLSEKDMKHELLKDFDSPFSIDMDLYPEFE